MQAGMINSAMLCVARFIQGLSNGLVLSGIPLYQAEVAPPDTRGLMVGLHRKDHNTPSRGFRLSKLINEISFPTWVRNYASAVDGCGILQR